MALVFYATSMRAQLVQIRICCFLGLFFDEVVFTCFSRSWHAAGSHGSDGRTAMLVNGADINAHGMKAIFGNYTARNRFKCAQITDVNALVRSAH
jgi:hypothetical protein